jgi:hypothetical protein
MSFPFRQASIPASQVRLTAAIVTAVSFSVLLFLASTNLGWLTPARGLLIPLGVLGGALFGWFETRTVIRGLTMNTEIIAWQIFPVGLVLFGLPLLLGKLVLADSAFLPFAGYLALPAVPALSAVSGWRFHQFEKKNKVQVFVLFIGYSYYRAPLIVDSNRLYHFIRNVESKDSYALYQQIGYSKRLMKALEASQSTDSATQKELFDVLKVMNKYRRIGLTALAVFLVSVVVVLAPIFTDMTGLTNVLNADTFNIIGPVAGGIAIGFVITVFLTLWKFQKTISSMTSQIDPKKLADFGDEPTPEADQN